MSTLKVNNLQDLGADAVVTNGVLAKAAFPAGTILQVVSTTKTDTFSASVASGAVSGDVTGVTATITPSATSSKVLVSAMVTLSTSAQPINIVLYADGSPIFVGDAAGSRARLTGGTAKVVGESVGTVTISALHSPNTTSAVVYTVRLHNGDGSTATLYVNRSGTDTDNSRFGRYASTITLMEVAG